MSDLDDVLDDLVAGNRILAREGIVDAWGHISVRHPRDSSRYFMAKSRAPGCVERDDIMEFALDGQAVDPRGRAPYLERFIHGAMLEARPEVHSVIHTHSLNVIPFGVGAARLRPFWHAAARIGREVPIWDIRARFGDTNMLVTSMEIGRDLAQTVGANATALMRGHGCVVARESVRSAVSTAIMLNNAADIQIKAKLLGEEITYLSPGEIDLVNTADRGGPGLARAWEFWCQRADVPFRE